MKTILYFHSRKNFTDKSTWGKEQLPPDYTDEEIKEVCRLAGIEGYAIVENNKVLTMKWFV